jgi:hypothetical protein
MGSVILQEDQAILRELARRSKDPRERERLRALYILSLGETVERVMAFFTVDESTVYRWIERWNRERDMQDKPRDGRATDPRISREEGNQEAHRGERSEEARAQRPLLGHQRTASLFCFKRQAIFP